MDDMTQMRTGMSHMGNMQMTTGTRSDHSKHMTMGDMSGRPERMDTPENSIVMMGGNGPHGIIGMGGMLTVLKVREHLTSYVDPGWYEAPRRTVAQPASRQELERDGIKG